MKETTNRPLVLKFGGSLVEQLGAQLYPSVTATVAELISNAWDADANNVWVEIPFDEDWSSASAQISVIDDGHGMTRTQAQDAYLVVGRRKRFSSLGDRSEGGRLVHGRKGIGKLAAFGTAGYLECTTLRDGVLTSFGIDYDELRRLNPDQDYYVDPITPIDPIVSPDGFELQHGTRVRLSSLRVRRKISAESFRLSMSRRFAIREMTVWINGTPLERFDMPLQFRLPDHAIPNEAILDPDGWARETMKSGDEVRWWIGFTEKPLTEGDQQGISVLARQKMAQRPFKFERAAGTTAQLGYEYLVGEVEADWLDQGDDIDTDYIQSNRDQIQVEDPRLDEFMKWGRERLAWALRARQSLRENAMAEQLTANPELSEIIGTSTSRDRRALQKVAERLMKVPEIELGTVNQIMKTVMNTRAEAQLKTLARDIDELDRGEASRMVRLAEEIDAIDSARIVATIEARVEILTKLIAQIESGDPPDTLQDFARSELWIVDPRLHLLSTGRSIDHPDIRALKKPTHDQLVVLAPDEDAELDEIVVLLAAGYHPANRTIDSLMVDRFTDFTSSIEEQYASHSGSPIVRGVIVAPAFVPGVPSVTRSSRLRISTTTWQETLLNSRELHLGWKRVSLKRSSPEG
ncbi:MAG TPA: ATP-binding protein [Terrimesophilobacter sp.]|nr:ATP-binding protein [Terrimesophilobacter sp.]